jgi:hypothetical protein
VCSAALLIAIFALAPGFALADFDGGVVNGIDGDTLTVSGWQESHLGAARFHRRAGATPALLQAL